MIKKINLALAFMVLMTLFSCEKDVTLTPNPSYNVTPTQRQDKMTADVEGKPWTAQTTSGARMGGVISITGIAADASMITITLIDKGVGTYKLGAAAEGNAAYQIKLGDDALSAGEDSTAIVVVTKIDMANKTISGTFSFDTYRYTDSLTKVITNGVFTNVSFITELSGGGNSNTLSADVDGSAFTAPVVNGVLLPGMGTLGITGTDNNASKSIGFQVPDNIAVGTYAFTGLGGTYIGQYNASATDFYQARSGDLVITKHDVSAKLIEGTFNFLAKTTGGADSVTVTNGVFSTTY